MDRIINMIINQVLRRFVKMGVDKGFGAMSNRKKPQPPAKRPPEQD